MFWVYRENSICRNYFKEIIWEYIKNKYEEFKTKRHLLENLKADKTT